MAGRSTLAELAENLGLSANTVSRALTGKDGVSDRTRDLVRAEATRIGYITRRSVDPTARASRLIALTIPSPTHAFSAEVLAAVETGARAAGYSLDLFITDETEQQESSIASSILDAEVAGAIVIPVQGASEPWTRVRTRGIPLVAVSRDIPGLDVDFVGVDSEAGEYAAVRHLLSQGARSILFLEEDLAISTIESRRRGFDAALAEVPEAHGTLLRIPTRRFEGGRFAWRAEEAYRACREVLATAGPLSFDAVTAGDDDFALGAQRALSERGLRVPEGVRIVGYGDHSYAEWVSPSLSSVRLPSRLVGELAVSLLLQRLSGDRSAPVRRLVRPELVVRASSAGA